MAAVSSVQDRPVPRDIVVFGEVGLSGEVRPVSFGEERLREAAKVGFRRAIVPRANVPREAVPGLDTVPVDNLGEALRTFRSWLQ
jgi:DNA repair protein RadA/Sms